MYRIFLISFTLMLFCAPLSISAESESPLQAEKRASTKTKKTPPLVVSASRGQAQDPLQVPASVDVISKEELEKKSYVDIDNALRELPGIGLAPAEGNPDYWQEGFTIRGLGAQRALVINDGVRQAGQGIGYGGGNLSLYDPFAIEKIELVRGPTSVLYGTDAFGGVLNIITRNPIRRSEAGANGALSYIYDDTRDMNRYSAYVDAGDENTGFVFGGSFSDVHAPDLPDNEDPDGGSFRQLGFWGKLDFYLDDNQRIRILGNLNETNDIDIADRPFALPVATFPPPGSSTPVLGPLTFHIPNYRRSTLGVEYDQTNRTGTFDEVHTGVYWLQLSRNLERNVSFYPTGSPGFAGPPLFFDPTATVNTSSTRTDDVVNTLEWHLQGRSFIESHTVTTGFDFGYDQADLKESEQQQIIGIAGVGQVMPMPGPQFTDRQRVDANQFRIGAYVQDNMEATENIRIVSGLRADLFAVENDRTDFDDEELGISGSVGMVYQQSKNHSHYINLASGFRAPDLGERFQDTVVNLGAPTRILGTQNLDDERSWSGEIGSKFRGERVQFEVAGYLNQIDDYIGQRDLGPVGGVLTREIDNLGSVLLYGTEAQASVQMTEGLYLFANAARTWTDDDDKLDVADWIFNYGLGYEHFVLDHGVESIDLLLRARSALSSSEKTVAVDGRDPFNEPGFTVLDLELTLSLLEGENFSGKIIAGVKNLLDKTYSEPFLLRHQPGRGVYSGITIEF